jgi:CHRD domain
MRYHVSASFIFMVAAALMLPVTAAYAAAITFTVALAGANEVPPVNSPGTGTAIVTLDPTAQTLQLDVTFSGLTSNSTAAHIHCCLLAGGGPNLMVATAVPAFSGFPLGVTSGTYMSPVFNLTQSSFYNPSFVTAEGGVPQAEAAFIDAFEHGLSYLNIHTVNNPGGEIRAQLVPAPIVGGGLPGLILAGGGLLAWWRRKRKATAAVAAA